MKKALKIKKDGTIDLRSIKYPSFKGMCHTKKTKKLLSEQRKLRIGEKSSNWKGGRMIVGNYVYIYSPFHPSRTKNKYVCEHRLIMERKLGRFLTNKEVVHHKDGNSLNNKLNNLKLYASSGEHTLKNHTKRNKKNGRFL